MNINQNRTFILIPAYNEGKKIASVLRDLKDHGYSNILVVDDGSKDNTKDVALGEGVEVLSHIINRGQGAALRTGMEYLEKTYSPDIIVHFDSDGQHQVEDLPAIIEPVSSGRCDISLGSRFLNKKSNISLLRKIILKAGVMFTNHISNIKLSDTHNGFRALGRKAIESIKITHRGMEHASDIIDEITKNNLRYEEVPVNITYTEYSKGNATNKNLDFVKMGMKIIISKISN